MEKDGLSEQLIIGQIEGVTRKNKKIKMQYGLHARIGLDNFINRNKLK